MPAKFLIGPVFICVLRAQSVDPERDALAALEVAKALIGGDPAASLKCASRAAAADPARQRWFWPLMLEADLKLGRWDAAKELGAKAVEEIEAGRMFGRVSDVSDEATLRHEYAEALDHRGEIEKARAQLAISAQLSGGQEMGDARSQAIVGREWAARVDRAKEELLAEEIKEPAPPFRLKNLDGHAVALADFRGKPVIAVFWATWCEPCFKEMESLNLLYPRLKGRVGILAISIDESTNVIAEFARKNAYAFPILKSDRSVEAGYTNSTGHIPQLYVIDGDGNIRFHLTSFDGDELFAQKLDWMIAAAGRPPGAR